MKTLKDLAAKMRLEGMEIIRLEWPRLDGGVDMRYFVNEEEVTLFEEVHLIETAFRDPRFFAMPVGNGRDKLVVSKAMFDD